LSSIFTQIKFPLPKTRTSGWAELRKFADDFAFNPLVWRIVEAVQSTQQGRYDFEGVVITGPPGVGKTSFVVQSMLYVFEDVNEVKKRLVFTRDQLLEKVKHAVESGERYDVLVVDDPGGMGLSAYWYTRERSEKLALTTLFDAFAYIKDVTSLLIMTVPRATGFAKAIRDLMTTWVQMKKHPGSGDLVRVVFSVRVATVSAGGNMREKFEPEEFFLVSRKMLRMPDEVWREMMEMRRKNVLKALKRLEEAVEEGEEEGEAEGGGASEEDNPFIISTAELFDHYGGEEGKEKQV
jgi:hypothetical protein